MSTQPLVQPSVLMTALRGQLHDCWWYENNKILLTWLDHRPAAIADHSHWRPSLYVARFPPQVIYLGTVLCACACAPVPHSCECTCTCVHTYAATPAVHRWRERQNECMSRQHHRPLFHGTHLLLIHNDDDSRSVAVCTHPTLQCCTSIGQYHTTLYGCHRWNIVIFTRYTVCSDVSVIQ